VSPCVEYVKGLGEYVRFQENSLLDRALLSLSLRSPFTGAQGRAGVCGVPPTARPPTAHAKRWSMLETQTGASPITPLRHWSHEAIRLSGGSVGSASIRTLAYLRGRGSTFWRWRRHLAPSGTVGLDKPRQAARSPNARRAVAPLAAPWPAVFQHDDQHGISKAYCVVCGVCIWVCGVSALCDSNTIKHVHIAPSASPAARAKGTWTITFSDLRRPPFLMPRDTQTIIYRTAFVWHLLV